MSAAIIAAGANPACQKVLRFADFHAGGVNRAQEMTWFASGKGINFIRAVRSLGMCSGQVVQFSGGDAGERLRRELETEELDHLDCPIAESTRSCTTCLDSLGNMTEIIEPAPEITVAEEKRFIELFQSALPGAAAVALSGTRPRGGTEKLYFQLLAAVPENMPVLLDCTEDLPELLASRPGAFLKINREELCAVSGTADIAAALAALGEASRDAVIGVTDGPHDAFLSYKNELWRFEIPRHVTIVNPVGSGDSVSAAWLCAMLNKLDVVSGFRLALGCGCANASSLKCGEFSPRLAREFAQAVKIHKE